MVSSVGFDINRPSTSYQHSSPSDEAVRRSFAELAAALERGGAVKARTRALVTTAMALMVAARNQYKLNAPTYATGSELGDEASILWLAMSMLAREDVEEVSARAIKDSARALKEAATQAESDNTETEVTAQKEACGAVSLGCSSQTGIRCGGSGSRSLGRCFDWRARRSREVSRTICGMIASRRFR